MIRRAVTLAAVPGGLGGDRRGGLLGGHSNSAGGHERRAEDSGALGRDGVAQGVEVHLLNGRALSLLPRRAAEPTERAPAGHGRNAKRCGLTAKAASGRHTYRRTDK